jgi:NhaP-type Na+/H+ or K+/H+ antiporter
MSLLLVFAITLVFAVLLSCYARQTVLSTAVLFLAAGLFVGKGWFNSAIPNREMLYGMAELALFAVLFTDGMKTGGLSELRRNWHLPGRALLIGMPLTIAGIALLAHFLIHLTWAAAFLIGAALSPTDPVFVSGIFGVEAVPQRVKYVLNVESGLNDGMSLPIVVIIIAILRQGGETPLRIVWELVLGVVIGVAIPWAAGQLQRIPFLGAAGVFERLNAFAIGLLVLAVAGTLHANLFLAAFSAGVTTASVSHSAAEAFHQFGELIAELLKLAALLIFGARIAEIVLTPMPALDYVFAALAVFAVRPPAIWAALGGTELDRNEVLTIGWFGPKGFASVVYALMILQIGSPEPGHIARVLAIAVGGSIAIYSSTDILVGRWYERRAARKPDQKNLQSKAA